MAQRMKKIVVVEDDERTLTEVLDWLYAAGYGAIGATNGRRGLELAQRLHPHLILCAEDAPELDGFTLLQEVRADPGLRQIPFVFVCAEGTQDAAPRDHWLDADDCLVKPFTPAQMLATVRKYLPEP